MGNTLTLTYNNKWRPPSLSELTPMIFNIGLTYLGSEVPIYFTELNHLSLGDLKILYKPESFISIKQTYAF